MVSGSLQTDGDTDPPARTLPAGAENPKFPFEIRELLYGKRKNKHRIIFTIRDDDVIVLFIHHGARKELEP